MTELTDEQLLKLAAIDGYDNIEPGEYEAPNERALEVYGSELVASMRAAIAADRRIRPQPTAEVGVEKLTDGELLELMPLQFRADLSTVSLMAANGAGTGVTPGLLRVNLNIGALDYARAAYQRGADRAARPTPTPEALQAAYAAWFKAEQGIPPSPAAARTAAAFTLAVLRGEVEE